MGGVAPGGTVAGSADATGVDTALSLVGTGVGDAENGGLSAVASIGVAVELGMITLSEPGSGAVPAVATRVAASADGSTEVAVGEVCVATAVSS
jgi:hypothetical protein